MTDRLKEEIDLIQSRYGEIDVDDTQSWFIIRRWKLPLGWNKDATAILIIVPPGYPVTPPDNFYADHDLRLAGGGQPGNTSLDQAQLGKQWLMFSFHIEAGDWHPDADISKGHNMLTFLSGVAMRLSEVS